MKMELEASEAVALNYGLKQAENDLKAGGHHASAAAVMLARMVWGIMDVIVAPVVAEHVAATEAAKPKRGRPRKEAAAPDATPPPANPPPGVA